MTGTRLTQSKGTPKAAAKSSRGRSNYQRGCKVTDSVANNNKNSTQNDQSNRAKNDATTINDGGCTTTPCSST